MKTIYLNMKTSYGVETVDEFTIEAGQSPIEFRRYISNMIKEYHLAGMNVYRSSRSANNWGK